MSYKSLVIVESPAKAKTIDKFLGPNYTVRSSMGHLIDLPSKTMGVDISHDFKPQYVVIPDRRKILDALKRDAQGKSSIYLATDPDREGEAISWHIKEAIAKGKKTYRVEFHEITKAAVQEAFKHPRTIDMNLVNAQQARRILDRIVGYSISPLLWRKVQRGLSAGRVQSVAVRLIVEREREIKAFIPQEYWSLEARLDKKSEAPPPAVVILVNPQAEGAKAEGEKKPGFLAKLEEIGGQKAELKNKEEADALLAEIAKEQFAVSKIDQKETRRNSPPPFTTSKLQQDAFNKLRFSARRTMLVAQQLYEGIELGDEGSIGLITYMRTDSVKASEQAISEVRQFIGTRFGKNYLPKVPNVYKSKKAAQEAHEAIRPTSVLREPEKIKRYLTRDQFRLYELIWRRFAASQMVPARYFVTTVDITAGRFLFRARGIKMLFAGFLAVYQDISSERENILPPLEVTEILNLLELVSAQHFTKPPARYTDASLVKALEENGIGRPSTYAPILHTIVVRGYVKRDGGSLAPTELGFIVTDLLIESFPRIIDAKFTAGMEEDLDEIEEGKRDWVETLSGFYRPFARDLKAASVGMRDVKKAKERLTDIACDACGKPMRIKWTKGGQFLACSGFPECRNTKPIEETESGEIKIIANETTNEVCDKCGKPMVIKYGRMGKFLSCSEYPKCKNAKSIPTGVKCPEPNCGGMLVQRRSRRGFFYGCSNYPKCRHISKKLPEQQV